MPAAMRLPMRVLVVAPNWIGDALLAQPLFARLQRRLPGVIIDALAPPWTGPVLARMPEINEVLDAPFAHGELRLKDRWRLGRSLRARAYSQVIVLPNSFKSALIPFFADIALRVGYVGESRYGLLNVVHKLDRAALPLMAERYAQLAEVPGQPVVRPLEAVRLRVDEANQLITMARLGVSRQQPVVVFCPGAEFGPSKRWPAEHFAALARRLTEQGRQVWLIGSQKDAPVGAAIASLSGGAALNLCGRTDLASAIDLIAAASLVVSNDSGLMHVAAATGRPLIALYGSSDSAHTPPLAAPGQARIVEVNGLECRPCFKRECPLGHFRCMKEISPEQVLRDIAAIEAA
jgi:heptosyltransferase-2